MQKSKITLLMPALLSQLNTVKPLPTMTNTALLLSKANKVKIPKLSDNLSHVAFMHGLTDTKDFPRAAFHLCGINEKPSTWVCYASPVIIQPNRDHLSIIQATGFHFTAPEADSLCAEFNDYFQEDGLHFSYSTSGAWFCHSEKTSIASIYAPGDILGENIFGFLPESHSDIQWRKLFNETQMLLHHSKTNQQRVAQGKPELNSLWFWGGGAMNKITSTPVFDRILTNNPEIAGFAQLSTAYVNELPEDLTRMDGINTGHTLIDLSIDQADNPFDLLENYLQQSINLLQENAIDSIEFIPDYGKKMTLNAKDLKKFWRRSKNITAFI